MSRVSDHTLIQHVEGGVVVVDEATGEEVVIPADSLPMAVAALYYLTRSLGPAFASDTDSRIDAEREVHP